jgi:hypothetical protein
MYIYTVEAMKGQKGKDGTPIKYQVKRVDESIPKAKKGRSEIIRDNLEYEDAIKLIDGFNDMEGKSQVKREEAARERNGL